MSEMSVFDKHQLAIARKTMQMHCTGVFILGGMSHPEALAILRRLSRGSYHLPPDCTCSRKGR